MAVMTEPTSPGERRLDRPPSDRYLEAAADEATAAEATSGGSTARGVLAATGVAIVGAIVTVVLGGVLAMSAGLLVVWAAVGYLTGIALKTVAGRTLPPPGRPILAAVLALVGIALGAVGLWVYAGTEGGVLPLLDYLAQAFGAVIPLAAVIAAGSAWWGGR
jgi:hypothetical protein